MPFSLRRLISLLVVFAQACGPTEMEGADRGPLGVTDAELVKPPIDVANLPQACIKVTPLPPPPEAPAALTEVAPGQFCPSSSEYPRRTVVIRKANPQVDYGQHNDMLDKFVTAVGTPNTTVLLGPDVVLDFSDICADDLPVRVAACVEVASVSKFPLPKVAGKVLGLDEPLPDYHWRDYPGRTPSVPGPLLKFGKHRAQNEALLNVVCDPGVAYPSDNVVITGLRIFGPDFGQQEVEDIGINVVRCLNVEISNMEIAGFGGQGIRIADFAENGNEWGPGQEQPSNLPGDRMGREHPVRVFRNYIHHNQHPSDGEHAVGYGIGVYDGAWAQISENVFDHNRHAIAARANVGGYEAIHNLVLKGGGLHYDGVLTFHTHQFDVHGSDGSDKKGGKAGVKFLYSGNDFQYEKDNAIFVRGTPGELADIIDNVFPHPDLEGTLGANAVNIYYRSDIGTQVFLGPNTVDYDSYGRYDVCDFDGDGVDDLFLATGKTWWFSSMGKHPWTFLSARNERINQLRFGYFDADKRCDVLTDSGGQWWTASGGTGDWVSLGAFGAPLSEVHFGRFDAQVRDHRPNVAKRTTHAFRRMPDGEWRVTPLSAVAWTVLGGSNFDMSKLRFGDFTGDGVTDVLAVEKGRWAISESGATLWQELNATLSDDVADLYIADLNSNNIDDILKRTVTRIDHALGYVETITWWISDDGRKPWRELKQYTLGQLQSEHVESTMPSFVGRFAPNGAGATLLINRDRTGYFFAPSGANWGSQFTY
jgi:hypothetical protein